MIVNNRYKIKTHNNFVDFKGIAKSIHQNIIKITLDDNNIIKASYQHIFYLHPLKTSINCVSLVKGMKLSTLDGFVTIKTVEDLSNSIDLLDIIEVDNNDNEFVIENNIITHNCQFLTSEKSLIDSEILNFYQTPSDFDEVEGFKIFEKTLKHTDSLIIITIDPSGGGEDNSAVHVWEIAPGQIIQLMTGVHPDWDASTIFKKILWLQPFLKETYNYDPSDAFLIFERNGVGEALSQILVQTEEAIENLEIPIFYDGKNKPGIHLHQTLKNKIALQFKTLVEYKKLIINDEDFVNELYGFINQHGSYSAKVGYNDDRIMAAFYVVFYVIEIFNDFATGDFSVDSLILVSAEDKITIEEEKDDGDDDSDFSTISRYDSEDDSDIEDEYDILPSII